MKKKMFKKVIAMASTVAVMSTIMLITPTSASAASEKALSYGTYLGEKSNGKYDSVTFSVPKSSSNVSFQSKGKTLKSNSLNTKDKNKSKSLSTGSKNLSASYKWNGSNYLVTISSTSSTDVSQSGSLNLKIKGYKAVPINIYRPSQLSFYDVSLNTNEIFSFNTNGKNFGLTSGASSKKTSVSINSGSVFKIACGNLTPKKTGSSKITVKLYNGKSYSFTAKAMKPANKAYLKYKGKDYTNKTLKVKKSSDWYKIDVSFGSGTTVSDWVPYENSSAISVNSNLKYTVQTNKCIYFKANKKGTGRIYLNDFSGKTGKKYIDVKVV